SSVRVCRFTARSPVVTVPARSAVIAVTTRPAIATISARSPLLALLKHGRLAFLMLLDPHGHEAQHFFGKAHLALHFRDRRRRRRNVHEREVCLAVLVDPVGEGLQAPVLDPADAAAVRFDDALVLFDQRIDLRGRKVLAGQEHILVESHWLYAFLPFALPSGPAAKPLRLS